MDNLLLLLLIIPLIGCLFILFSRKNADNAFMVALFTLSSNILLLLKLLSEIKRANVIEYSYEWLKNYDVTLVFGADMFSMILLLGVHIAVIIGLVGLNENQRQDKILQFMTLYFMWNITGFLLAKDVIAFYLFFTNMILPLFIMIGLYGNVKKSVSQSLFFLFNYIGAMLFLISMIILYRKSQGSIFWVEMSSFKLPHHLKVFVWYGIIGAFILRIPVWPLHNWISYISGTIKNPLVYIATNMLPLTGLYGIIRFWPLILPRGVTFVISIIEMFILITMMFIALIGISHKNFLQKLFSYSTIYYLLFLFSFLVLEDKYVINIAYSLFIFLIVNASLAVLEMWSDALRAEYKLNYSGILGHMPHLAILFAFFILIAIGLPISSMFWNNFTLVSALFRNNFNEGIWVMIVILLIALALVYELYEMLDLKNKSAKDVLVIDISDRKLAFFMAVITVLLLSFFNPLWFVL